MINYGAGDLKNYPVEVIETKYPLLIHEYGLRVDSGGRGRYRGGLGIVRTYETLADDVALTLWLERSEHAAWGLFGGHDGEPTHGILTIDGESETLLKTPPRVLPKGSTLQVMTGGGGGYGDPSGRDPEAITDDLEDGYYTNWEE